MEDWTSCIRWMQCQPFWPTEVHEQEQSDPQRGQSCHMCQSAAARLQLRCKPTRRRPPHLVVAQHKVALAGSQVDAHSWVLGPGVRHLCRCTSGTSRAAHEAETGGHLASRQACGWKLAGHMGSRHACIHSALSNRLPGTHPGAHGLPAVAARGVPAHQYGVRASDEPTSGKRVLETEALLRRKTGQQRSRQMLPYKQHKPSWWGTPQRSKAQSSTAQQPPAGLRMEACSSAGIPDADAHAPAPAASAAAAVVSGTAGTPAGASAAPLALAAIGAAAGLTRQGHLYLHWWEREGQRQSLSPGTRRHACWADSKHSSQEARPPQRHLAQQAASHGSIGRARASPCGEESQARISRPRTRLAPNSAP